MVLWARLSRELSACAARVCWLVGRRCTIVSVDDVNVSTDRAEVEVFRNMQPSVVIVLDDAEYEEFINCLDDQSSRLVPARR